MRPLLTLAAVLAIGMVTRAADPKPSFDPLMTKPGKLLLAEDFDKGLGKEWRVAKGRYEAKDGAVVAAELPTDMHGAVARRNLEMKDAIIELTFRLDGSKGATISLNGAKGHVCRVTLRPTGLGVQKDDQDGKAGADKAVVLGLDRSPIKEGEWHTVLLELRGPEMLARLDGKAVAYGRSEAVDKPKTNVGITVAGQSASFKKLRIWEAEANPTWDAKGLKREKQE